MKTAGLRAYFYEYLYHQAVTHARERSGQVIPISQAIVMRREIERELISRGTRFNDPTLEPPVVTTLIDEVLRRHVRGYEPQFGDHSTTNARYQGLYEQFLRITNVTDAHEPGLLPISPYSPTWSRRYSVKKAGTQLRYIDDESLTKATQGAVADLESYTSSLPLWSLDEDGTVERAGWSISHDDAAGLTALSRYMTEREYSAVRDWVLDGAKDRQGRIDRSRFMSAKAVSRCVAVLDELQKQGLRYEISRDWEPGQIKATVLDTGMEIRLIDIGHEEYAGARIYDDGTIIRFTTNHHVGTGVAIPSPAPEQAVRLLHLAQGRPIPRLDRPDAVVGQVGPNHTERARGRDGLVTVPDAYYVTNTRESMFTVGQYRPATDSTPASQVMVRRDGSHHTLPQFFATSQAAEDYGRAAVASARDNFMAALDVDGLITAFDDQVADGLNLVEITPPEFSSRPDVAAIQRTYWDILTGARTDLLRPGATDQMYRDRLAQIEASDTPMDMGNLVYSGTPADKIRAHASDVTNELIGHWDPEVRHVGDEWVNQRFHPGRVAAYMTSDTGQWQNLDNLAAALRRCDVTPDEMIGDDYQVNRFKDTLIQFDSTTAVAMADHPSPFIQRIGQTVSESIERNAATVDDIAIDSQGVIQWRAHKLTRSGELIPMTGEIGQVFDVGDHGEIVTHFASGSNSLIVPGYEARIIPSNPDEDWTPVEQRTRLRGYEQLMTERIQYQISTDIMASRSRVGDPTSLNRVYSRLYGTRHPVDYLERATTLAIDPNTNTVIRHVNPWVASIVDTEARRVRYPNVIHDESTTYAAYQAEHGRFDPADDNFFHAWQLTGRNMAILTGTDDHGVDAPAGFFDPVMTGGQKNQGIVRYLTTDAQVTSDGQIIPGDPTTVSGTRAPLMTRPELDTMRYDPWDRQQMATSTIMQSAEVTAPVETALATFGGWNAEDGIVVSRDFADRHRIRGVDGQLRPLIAGDKLSDFHGNKGTITLIVDRDMDMDEARAQGLDQAVTWFNENRQMDVVMSPFSLISRRNAGSARELMSSPVNSLYDPESDTITPGGLGDMRFVVTHLAVDDKTKIYDDEQIQAGKGRNASGQLAWALQSHGCSAVMKELYGSNNTAEADLREYLRVTGIDMTADTTLRLVGSGDDESPARRVLTLPPAEEIHTSTGRFNSTAVKRAVGMIIGDRGGDMAIPFPLTHPTGEETERFDPHQADGWKLPILSSHLRSGQTFSDGASTTHDYTHHYQNICVEACKYRDSMDRLNDPTLSADRRATIQTQMDTCVTRAQRSFDALTRDIIARTLTGKHNLVRSGLMSSRLRDSATMVWTGDPRLDIDQVAMSSQAAAQLGLTEGDHALVWRDPELRGAGVRYLRVALDDRLTGVAINPALAAQFDGDFDGDSVAVVTLHSKAAQAEALTRLTVGANLLDKGRITEDGTHPLASSVALDTQVAVSRDPGLAHELQELHADINRRDRAGELDDPAHQREMVTRLSSFYRRSQGREYGTALSFSDIDTHLQSIREACVDTGAKGDEKKLAAYARNFGDENGVTGLTRTDHEASMTATAVKTDATGLAGKYSQRAVRAGRDKTLESVLEVTYPVTQSVLQVKHDAAEAHHKYEMLHGPGRELWRGRLLDPENGWTTVYADGQPVQADRDTWVDQFCDFYRSATGFHVNVNRNYVEDLATSLVDSRTGQMRNLEEDPELAGSIMDQLAYDGTFETWTAAARDNTMLYGDPMSLQFACAGTRRLIDNQRRTERAASYTTTILDGPGGIGIAPEPPEPTQIPIGVIKPDVIADGHTRGSGRRSAYAVGATPSFDYQRLLTSTTTTPSVDVEMSL